MKRYWSGLLALALVVVMGLTGCSSPTGLTGNYREDTLSLIDTLQAVIELPQDATNKAEVEAGARERINDFASRYRRDTNLTKLNSFTTMRTALNSIAGHYSSYPNRPLPQKLRDRLKTELQQVQVSLNREG